MKTTLLFLLLITFLNFKLYSQDYEPMLKEGSFWDMKTFVITSTCPENVETLNRIQIAGDTLIKGKLYKKLKYVLLEDKTDNVCITPPYFYNPKNFIPIKDKFIREDINEKRLYILTKLENDFFEEFTVCDFSLNIGDELENYFGYDNSNPDLKLVVEDIKTDKSNQKVFYLNDGSYYTEGIGKNGGNLNIYHNLVDGTYERVYCSGNLANPNDCATRLKENYSPLLKDGAFWDVESFYSDGSYVCYFLQRRYTIDKDTIINDKTYKKIKITKIYAYESEDIQNCYGAPYYIRPNDYVYYLNEYLREDISEKKVYVWSSLNNTSEFKEYTLYDFSLKDGDIMTNSYAAVGSMTGEKDVTVSVTVNDKGEKVFNSVYDIYTEGIGSHYGLCSFKSTAYTLNPFSGENLFCWGNKELKNSCASFFKEKEYEPVIKENSFWDIVSFPNHKNKDDDIYTNQRRYIIDKDTLINNKVYKKIKVKKGYSSGKTGINFPLKPYYIKEEDSFYYLEEYIREDISEKKVYVFANKCKGCNNKLDKFQEYTLYDYNLKAGDTIKNSYVFDSDVPLKEIDIDLNGRKRYKFDYLNFSYKEGIGSDSGICNFKITDNGREERLLCWGNKEVENNCSKTLNTKKYELSTVKVFPNPVDDILQITNADNLTVRLFSIDGKLIKKEIFKNKVNLDVSYLTHGIYFIELSKLNSKKRLKFLKK
ncbi:T9SS C-terminal target domain-containing protein [Polaribacter sp. WD7]|uniref:T9SS type A sorting domain-containing protein n=1 Tax=Polaribacter sp. WD7 TaxID=2269061 RepID=UPI000DF27247|nr:T9SS type A sorting domain-containing protein [Polaribacter sp. WD7]RCS27639.1 T9SS C-terminal target domain-containing protein [Polaribacter sp. WD7]